MSKLAEFLKQHAIVANPANSANPYHQISSFSDISSETVELPQRIRLMAKRWGYSREELAEALAGAQSDHTAWLAWTERDERDFGHCATPEDFAEAYRRARGLE
jgi:hypothetical protein